MGSDSDGQSDLAREGTGEYLARAALKHDEVALAWMRGGVEDAEGNPIGSEVAELAEAQGLLGGIGTSVDALAAIGGDPFGYIEEEMSTYLSARAGREGSGAHMGEEVAQGLGSERLIALGHEGFGTSLAVGDVGRC
jgi:hypothetical protein